MVYLLIRASYVAVHLIHKSQNAPVPYPTMVHSEQKCAHFCSEWIIVGVWNRCILGFVKLVYDHGIWYKYLPLATRPNDVLLAY